jgi:hypothetical protein
MCVWNYGVFDNDTALDLEDDLKNNPVVFFKSSFKHALESDFLEQDQACAVLVSAAYIDHYINGTSYYEDTIKHNLVAKKAHTFKSLKPSTLVKDSLLALVPNAIKPLFGADTHAVPITYLHSLIAPAIAAIDRVVSDESELSAIWREDELLFPLWQDDKFKLIDRLKTHLSQAIHA